MTQQNDNLQKAREAKGKQTSEPWTIAGSMQRHYEFEAERRESLLADEDLNPANYMNRAKPLPNIDICRKCNATDVLVVDVVNGVFKVLTCPLCGTCYYPDAEPVPRSDLMTARPIQRVLPGGRHHVDLPGEHYNEWAAEYRRNRKKKDNNDA